MESRRRRRRLLERSADVSSEESCSWRARVYQQDRQDSGSSERDSTPGHPVKEECPSPRTRGLRESGRRRSEDSPSSDLAERLARRRQRRLEELGGCSGGSSVDEREEASSELAHHERRRKDDRLRQSQDGSVDDDTGGQGRSRLSQEGSVETGATRRSRVSQDGSLDSPASGRARLSQDASTESVGGDLEERIAARRAARRQLQQQQQQDKASGDGGGSKDGDDGTPEHSPRPRHQGSRDSEASSGGTGLEEGRGRKWSSRDSSNLSFYSADSSRSLDGEQDVTSAPAGSVTCDDVTRGSRGSHGDSGTVDHGKLSLNGHREGLDGRSGSDVFAAPPSGNGQDTASANVLHVTNGHSSGVQGSGEDGVHQRQARTTRSVDDSDPAVSSSRWRRAHLTASASLDTEAFNGGAAPARRRDSLHDRLRKMRGDVEDGGDFWQPPPVQEGQGSNPSEERASVDSQPPDRNTSNTTDTTNNNRNGSGTAAADVFATPPSSPLTSDGGVSDDVTRARRRKSRKDKSAARKSALNSRIYPPDSEEDGQDSGDLLAGLGQADSSRQDDVRGRRKPISATRQKFNKASSAETSDPSSGSLAKPTKPSPGEERADATSKRLRGRTDFSQLLQKFSGSEASASEKSDTDGAVCSTSAGTVSGIPRRRSLVRRQEAKDLLTSSEDSDAAVAVRKTPERTQSLKISRSLATTGDSAPSAGSGEETSRKARAPVEKSSSFRSEFMTRRLGRSRETSSQESSPREEASSTPRSTVAAASGGVKSSSSSTSFSSATTTTTATTATTTASTVDNNKSTGRTSRTKTPSEDSGGRIPTKTCGPGAPQTLDGSLALLSRVTDELEHPEKPSSLAAAVLAPRSREAAGSGGHAKTPSSSLAEAQSVVKAVETSISSAMARRSPDKLKSPLSGAGDRAGDNSSSETAGKTAGRAFDFPAQREQRQPSSSERSPPPVMSPVEVGGSANQSLGDSEKNVTRTLRSSATTSSPKLVPSKSLPSLVSGASQDSEDGPEVNESFGKSSTTTTTLSSSTTTTTTMSATSSSTKQRGGDQEIQTPTQAGFSSASSSVRRTASVRDVKTSASSEGGGGERRKGILKRATSLKSVSSAGAAPVVDSQLAKILQQRRQLQGDVEEEEEEEGLEGVPEGAVPQQRRKSRGLSAAEEIEETLKYSQQLALEKGLRPEEDLGLQRCSVADRVSSMQCRIEEETRHGSASSLSPRSRSSGMSTPRSARSVPLTPTQQKSLDGQRSPQPALSPRTPTSTSAFDVHTFPSTSSTSTSSLGGSNSTSTKNATALSPSSKTTGPSSSSSSSVSSSSSTTTSHVVVAAAASSGPGKEDLGAPTAMSSPLSGEALVAKLTKIADSTEAYQERRQRFQGRGRDDWRHLTQPVTVEEIQAADSLQSVSAFRALIRKKTSVNAFDQLRAQTPPPLPQGATPATRGAGGGGGGGGGSQQHPQKKGAGGAAGDKEVFPRHLAPPPARQSGRPKGVRDLRHRHRTLPVTAEELKAVPENQVMVTQTKDVDSGVSLNSQSEVEQAGQDSSQPELQLTAQQTEELIALSLEMDLWEHDPARMSVSDKASMFKTLEERTKADKEREREKEEKKSASGARRYINRKKRERSQTMPITEEEVKTAAELEASTTASGGQEVKVGAQPEVVNRSRSGSVVSLGDDGELKQEDDELLKLSISDKVRLFSQPKEEVKPPVKPEAPVKRRRNRKHASRFSTQPVTSEEVEKAANFTRISPLAMSMVKPPDPEILKGLPLKDQRQLMAQHAEACLSQSSSRSHSRTGSTTSLQASSTSLNKASTTSSSTSSQPSSRRASIADNADLDKKGAGILKDQAVASKDPPASGDPRSILKPEVTKPGSEVHSILKPGQEQVEDLSVPIQPTGGSASSLASTDSGVGVATQGPPPRGILKKSKSEEAAHQGILKHADSEEEDGEEDSTPSPSPRSRSNSQPQGILKSETAPLAQEVGEGSEVKGILKDTPQDTVQAGDATIKSALRRGSLDSDSSSSSASVLRSAMRGRQPTGDSEEEVADATKPLEPSSSSSSSSSLPHHHRLHKDSNQTSLGESEQPPSSSSLRRRESEKSSEKQRSPPSSLPEKRDTSSSAPPSANTSGVPSLCLDFSAKRSETTSTTITTAALLDSQFQGVDNVASKDSIGVPADKDRLGPSASESESSSGELLEDTPRRRRRRNRFSESNKSHERYKTQPPELPPDPSNDPDGSARRKFKYEGRHKTQPITPSEMKDAETTPSTNLTRTPGGSIADRLNQLKTSGEEQWRRRVKKDDQASPMPEAVVKLRERVNTPAQRPSSIADRLSELEVSKQTWKGRVEDTDAKQFTVAGKLGSALPESPLISKIKTSEVAEPAAKKKSPASSPLTPTKDFLTKIPIPKDIPADLTAPTVVSNNTTSRKAGSTGGGGDKEEEESVKVAVPQMGAEVEAFFATKDIEEIKDTVEMEVDDFDDIFIESEMILPTVRKVRPTRKKKASSANPLKTMAQKVSVQQEYLQISHGTAEKEFKRMKKEKLSKDAGYAQEALAGLASKENFKQVELRRSDSGSMAHGQRMEPFNEVMLLHVKGRRMVQTRLVEPHTRSLNSGDCFILVTPDKVILWEGQFANVIEKNKASEQASFILQKKDLGCKRAAEVQSVQQTKDHLGAGKAFYQALEGDRQCQACGPDQEDEVFESSIVRANMVYRLEGNALKPYEDFWGCVPRHSMLKKNEVLIFDFGTELYVWQGKQVTMEQRKLGMRLARQLYDRGYDYSHSAINNFSPLRNTKDGGLPVSADKRPKWTIFGKINQNMETILFREKFSDWPDSTRLIGMKGHDGAESSNKEHSELKAFDAEKMLTPSLVPVSLKLEGENVGRGQRWMEDMQGFIKQKDIITRDVAVWHVMEYDHYKMEPASYGQFHDGDTYVVRWQYMMANANLRSLKGSAARNSLTGRERCAYFFWQGNNSTINEKGASALMTVELDEERGPQVRVLEGKEPPCFLNLFDGSMVLHIGKREEPSTNTQGPWRLYCLRGDYPNEVYLLEIPMNIEHLRSRSSLVLVNVRTGLVYVWHGVKSSQHVRDLARKAVDKIAQSRPLEMGFHKDAAIVVTEMEEGEERREFWVALDSRDRTIYHSLLTDPRPYRHTVRLFHMSSVNMVFEVHEQLNPSRPEDDALLSPFPFLQADLYKATQPALFLLDNQHELFLWLGWWPTGCNEHENVHTGSATSRFNADRRCALETALNYSREKNPDDPPKTHLVFAGVEPKCFTSLFPYWLVDTVVRDLALEEGKTEGSMEPVSLVLQRLTQTRYSLAQLQDRPLPEGVDPLKLEAYLHDEEFEEILEMNREEFYAQPSWKQRQMKQFQGLF